MWMIIDIGPYLVIEFVESGTDVEFNVSAAFSRSDFNLSSSESHLPRTRVLVIVLVIPTVSWAVSVLLTFTRLNSKSAK